jgi:hypothetical protein
MMRFSQFGDQLFLTELYFLKIETSLDSGGSFKSRPDRQNTAQPSGGEPGEYRRLEAISLCLARWRR